MSMVNTRLSARGRPLIADLVQTRKQIAKETVIAETMKGKSSTNINASPSGEVFCEDKAQQHSAKGRGCRGHIEHSIDNDRSRSGLRRRSRPFALLFRRPPEC
jgi:hypothetical protein